MESPTPRYSHSIFHVLVQSQILGLDKFTALDTLQIRHCLKQGKAGYSPGASFGWHKASHPPAAIAGYMCMQQPTPSARRDSLLGNSFCKTSDFADGPTLAATRVRTTFSVPSALQTASSENPLLSLQSHLLQLAVTSLHLTFIPQSADHGKHPSKTTSVPV